MLILVLGDIHIPQRAADIPTQFRKLLVPGKIDMILCTGNLTDQATLDYLYSITPTVKLVRGEFDTDGPLSLRETIMDQLRVGLVNGHSLVPSSGDVDTLAGVARQMDVDVLVSGNTHRFEAYEEQGRFFINPGSITGAMGSQEAQAIPSFVLMECNEQTAGKLSAYVYQLVEGEVTVDCIEYVKN